MSDKDCSELSELRRQIDDVNGRILDLLNERAGLVLKIQGVKEQQDISLFSPGREKEMLDALLARNSGPFSDATVKALFKEIFRASLESMETTGTDNLRISRKHGQPDIIVTAGGREIGRKPIIIAGPCAIESAKQASEMAAILCRLGVGFMRGAAFKPRTSPYSFQGLGLEALAIIDDIKREYGLTVVTEVTDTRSIEAVAKSADILQIGARNMANYELLKAAGATGHPVLIKRGFAATLDEFLLAAEYVAREGNTQIILCERGIRTFARETRFTLDISAVPLLRGMCRLPVIVDVSHAAGRRDLIVPLAKAALAAGASGVMVEVHPMPSVAMSDSAQQLDPSELEAMIGELGMMP